MYIEKPGGVDVTGCKRVMKAADSAPRHLNITFGFQQRYSPLYQKGKKMIDEGGPILGRLKAIAQRIRYLLRIAHPNTCGAAGERHRGKIGTSERGPECVAIDVPLLKK